MKKCILIISLVCAVTLNAQSFKLFNLDSTNYPFFSAEYLALDNNWQQIINLGPDDFQIMENGQEVQVISAGCDNEEAPNSLSAVIMIDKSGSMTGEMLELAQVAARGWVAGMPKGKGETAICTFNDANYFVQDFTDNKPRLMKKIDSITAGGGTRFDAGFIEEEAGAIPTLKDAKYRPVIIFITDGHSEGSEQEIIDQAIDAEAVVYCVTLNNTCPDILRNISAATLGSYFENVTTMKQAEDTYKQLLALAYGYRACTLEWQGIIPCVRNVSTSIKCKPLDITKHMTYLLEEKDIAKLIIEPYLIKMGAVLPSEFRDTTITVTAQNHDFEVTGINTNNPAFAITPSSFQLAKGESIDLTLRFTPVDKAYTFAKLQFETNMCSANVFCSGGFPGVQPQVSPLVLTHPNGSETFLAGSDTIVTWEGLLPEDRVRLELSRDNGQTWEELTNIADGLKYNWQNVPMPPSDECLVRVISGNGQNPEEGPDMLKTSISQINFLKYSPDGFRIALGIEYFVVIVDSEDFSVQKILYDRGGKISDICWNHDGSKLATGHLIYGKTKIWDCTTGELLNTIVNDDHVNSISWSPDGSTIAIVSAREYDSYKKMTLWDPNTGILIKDMNLATQNTDNVRWSPDGLSIAFSELPNKITVIDPVTGAEKFNCIGHINIINELNWSPDGSKIASCSDDETVIIWNTSDGSSSNTFTEHTGSVKNVIWDPVDGSRIASYSSNIIKIFNTATSVTNSDIFVADMNMNAISWKPDGTTIATGGNYSLNLWETVSGSKDENLLFNERDISGISWSPDGSKIVSAGKNNTTFIWDSETMLPLDTIVTNWELVDAKWSPDGTRIALIFNSRATMIWSAETHEYIQELNHLYNPLCFAWGPNGDKFATGHANDDVVIWDANDYSPIDTLSDHSNNITCLEFSPDGALLASGSRDDKLIIWDMDNHENIWDMRQGSDLTHLSWAPDSKKIVCSYSDKKLRIYDTKEHITQQVFELESGEVRDITCVGWSPDGLQIAAAYGGSLILWDPDSGEIIKAFGVSGTYVQSVAFSPDATQLATGTGFGAGFGSSYGLVSTWNIGSRAVLDGEDVSDDVFSIVAPDCQGMDVYMGTEYLNKTRTQLKSEWLSNPGSYPVRVDSITYSGPDATQFATVPGYLPVIIEPGATAAVEFAFSPASVGPKSGIINLHFQAGVYTYNITGIGEWQDLVSDYEVGTRSLDFGTVEISQSKTLNEIMVRNNNATETIQIDSIRMLGPDRSQFQIVTGADPVQLTPGQGLTMDLKFEPHYIGRTSGSIGFYYKGSTNPLIAGLYGRGLGADLIVLDDSAKAGEHFTIKVDLDVVSYDDFVGEIGAYDIELYMDKTVITPEDPMLIQNIDDDYIHIKYSAETDKNAEHLAEIPCIAGLGQSEYTEICIEGITWYNADDGSEEEFDTEFTMGHFRLLGICPDGGQRLINPNSQIAFKQITPNPSNDKVKLEYELSEEGTTEIVISNSLGQIVMTYPINPKIGVNSLELDTADLSSGQYFVQLRTPTHVAVQRLVVRK